MAAFRVVKDRVMLAARARPPRASEHKACRKPSPANNVTMASSPRSNFCSRDQRFNALFADLHVREIKMYQRRAQPPRFLKRWCSDTLPAAFAESAGFAFARIGFPFIFRPARDRALAPSWRKSNRDLPRDSTDKPILAKSSAIPEASLPMPDSSIPRRSAKRQISTRAAGKTSREWPSRVWASATVRGVSFKIQVLVVAPG